MFPSLFVSHGAPSLPFDDVPARDFLRGLGQRLGRPRAIVVASAHWETQSPRVSACATNDTIHDFGGFPDELYRLRYDAPGDPELAGRVKVLLGEAGLSAEVDARRGLDHGAWVPLMLMWPTAEIPVLQLSLQTALGPRHHVDLGRALAPLRAEDILILGSGSFTHDLRRVFGRSMAAAEEPDVVAFGDWTDDALLGRRLEDLVDYRARAPFAVRNHPTEEHLLPLFVACGAAGDWTETERLHRSVTFGALRMDAYAFA